MTENGKKYHTKDCPYAKNAKEMSLSDAKAKGYTPCSSCIKVNSKNAPAKDAPKPQTQQAAPAKDAKKK